MWVYIKSIQYMPIDADIDKMTNVERAEKNDRFSNKTY